MSTYNESRNTFAKLQAAINASNATSSDEDEADLSNCESDYESEYEADLEENKSEDDMYEGGCAAPRCTPDHWHKWKGPDTSYVYGPYTCVECKEKFMERTSTKYEYPECKCCRDLKKQRKKSKPHTRR